jgi:hypothetical protein
MAGDSTGITLLRRAVVAVRWLTAAACVPLGLHLFALPLLGGMMATGAFVLAALLIAPEATGWLARPFAGLYFPTRRLRHAPPDLFALAEWQTARDRIDDALRTYRRLLDAYPPEPRVYEAMLRLATLRLNNPALAETLLAEANARLRRRDARALAAKYRPLRPQVPLN